jgi:flagellum-specific peptidoglycan hydrolase FlgJ
MDIQQRQFIQQTAQAADQGGHIFPLMAACEAALESSYGTSRLAIQDRNLFGTKQHVHPIYGTASIPTKEFIHGIWVVVTAEWVVYPTLADCFKDRMNTLQTLRSVYLHYDSALKATDPITYVTQVSKSWSTDPNRANTAISIYRTYAALGLGK